MPNIKLFVDQSLLAARESDLRPLLLALREIACRDLAVPASGCQLAVVGVIGLPDQPMVNLEFHYLAKPERTTAVIGQLCAALADCVSAALDTHAAVRAMPLDPASFVARK